MRPSAFWGAATAALVIASTLVLTSVTEGGAAAPTRVLILGDSVTQGSEGDWTWRYRLWQHLRSTRADVDLVGPNSGVCCDESGRPESPAYADAAFDSDHAARWGMTLERQDYPVGDLVETFHPDVVVEYLGFNDLVWRGTSPDAAVAMAEDLVRDVRAADPDTDVVLGLLPQTWKAGVDEFNAGLVAAADALDTPTSAIRVARPEGPFVQDVDTWDPAHPSATGEVKIAAGVADALARIGVGAPFRRPLPMVANGPIAAPVLVRATPGDREAQLAWTLPAGATASYVWIRDATVGEPWRRLPYPVTGSAWTAGGLLDFHDYEFRLQATKGTAVAETVFSNVVVSRPAPAAMGPLTLTPQLRGIDLLWPRVADATSYVVTWASPGSAGGGGSQVSTTASARLRGLVAGQRYAVSVTPRWGEDSGAARTATGAAGGPALARVSHLSATLDRRARVRLVWTPSTQATAYDVQRRSPNGGWTAAGTTTGPALRTQSLPRGRHAFRVRARFDLLVGPWSSVLAVRVP